MNLLELDEVRVNSSRVSSGADADWTAGRGSGRFGVCQSKWQLEAHVASRQHTHYQLYLHLVLHHYS